jgi:hypothetical protein
MFGMIAEFGRAGGRLASGFQCAGDAFIRLTDQLSANAGFLCGGSRSVIGAGFIAIGRIGGTAGS